MNALAFWHSGTKAESVLKALTAGTRRWESVTIFRFASKWVSSSDNYEKDSGIQLIKFSNLTP